MTPCPNHLRYSRSLIVIEFAKKTGIHTTVKAGVYYPDDNDIQVSLPTVLKKTECLDKSSISIDIWPDFFGPLGSPTSKLSLVSRNQFKWNEGEVEEHGDISVYYIFCFSPLLIHLGAFSELQVSLLRFFVVGLILMIRNGNFPHISQIAR